MAFWHNFRVLMVVMLSLIAGQALSMELKLVTWNMYWMTEENNDFNHRSDSDYLNMRRYATELDADIVALQEVENERAAFRIFGPQYTYYFAGKESGLKQNVAILVRNRPGLRVEEANSYWPLNVNSTLRDGIDIIISGGTEKLRIFNVHLKTGCPNDDLNASTAEECKLLNQQTEALERYVGVRSEEPIPFMVVGDFNRHLNRETMRELDTDMLMRLNEALAQEDKELTVINTGEPQCWASRFEEYIDYMLADYRAATRIVPGTLEEKVFKQTGYKDNYQLLSDHCALSTRLVLQ